MNVLTTTWRESIAQLSLFVCFLVGCSSFHLFICCCFICLFVCVLIFCCFVCSLVNFYYWHLLFIYFVNLLNYLFVICWLVCCSVLFVVFCLFLCLLVFLLFVSFLWLFDCLIVSLFFLLLLKAEDLILAVLEEKNVIDNYFEVECCAQVC